MIIRYPKKNKGTEPVGFSTVQLQFVARYFS